jgi:hypothetical protein
MKHNRGHHVAALAWLVSPDDLKVGRHVVFDDTVAGRAAEGEDEAGDNAALLEYPRWECSCILLAILIPDE